MKIKMEEKRKNMMNNQNNIKIISAHILISLLIPLVAMFIFDLSGRLFTNVWEYFHFFTGALGLFFFCIPTQSVLFVLSTIILRVLIIYLLIKISYKSKKIENIMYVVSFLIAAGTVFIGYYIMLIARL